MPRILPDPQEVGERPLVSPLRSEIAGHLVGAHQGPRGLGPLGRVGPATNKKYRRCLILWPYNNKGPLIINGLVPIGDGRRRPGLITPFRRFAHLVSSVRRGRYHRPPTRALGSPSSPGLVPIRRAPESGLGSVPASLIINPSRIRVEGYPDPLLLFCFGLGPVPIVNG